jgi:membrane protein YdbS with pleckstrin-like domain
MPDDEQDDGSPAGGSVTDAARAAGAHSYKPASYIAVEAAEAVQPPPMVARYLMASELRAGVIAVRQHWIVLVLPALAVAGGLVLAITVNSWLYENREANVFNVRAVWIAYLILAAWGAWRYYEWRCWWFVVTGGRLMVISGALRRTVTPLPLKRVRDMELKQSPAGRQLGYGTIECESIATDHALHTVSSLPFTVELWSQIWSQLLPGAAQGVKFEGMADDAW